MISSDFRAEARRKLIGKWGKGACIMLAYIFISFVLSFVFGLLPDSYNWIGQIINAIIEVPLSFGLAYAFLKLYKDEDVSAFDFLKLGFNNFGKSWSIVFNVFLKMIVPSIAFAVSYIIFAFGIVMLADSSSTVSTLVFLVGFVLTVASSIWFVTKSYFYQLALFIAMENEGMSASDAVKESERAMAGRRAKLFWLQLSFIGWIIVGSITFGIGLLWIIPYVNCAIIVFYKDAIGCSSDVEVKLVDNDSSISE